MFSPGTTILDHSRSCCAGLAEPPFGFFCSFWVFCLFLWGFFGGGYLFCFLFTGKKEIFPANTGRKRSNSGSVLPLGALRISICSKQHWFKTVLLLLSALLGKTGQSRQHVNNSGGVENNNLMDCFGTSSQLHCSIHPHKGTSEATAWLLLLPSAGSLLIWCRDTPLHLGC